MKTKTFHKSTREEVMKMLELRKEGKSVPDIAEILHRDRTTIIYWFDKIGPNNIFVERCKPKEVISEQTKEPEIGKDRCKVCLKEKKDERYRKTDYCGLKCWHEENNKTRQTFYW